MKKFLRAISLVFDLLYRFLTECSKLVLLVTVLIVSAQVIARTFIGESIRWSEEAALLLMVWTAFIAMAIGVEKHMHISVTLFYDRFPKWMQNSVDKINNIVILGFGAALVYYGIKLMEVTSTSTLPATKLPASMLYMMMPVSGIFIVYFSLIDLFGLQWLRHKNIEEGEDENV